MIGSRILECFGNRLRVLRCFAGFTQEELSERVGISVTHLSNIERGQASPSFAVIEGLCEVFGVRPVNLFHFPDFEEKTADDAPTVATPTAPRPFGFLKWMGTWTHDLVEHRLHFSDGLYRLFGFGQVRPEPSLELLAGLIHPEDRQWADSAFERAMRGEPVTDLRLRFYRRDGSHRRAAISTETLRGDYGHPAAIHGVFLDVTEWVATEDALLEDQRRLEARVRERTAELNRTVARLQAEMEQRSEVPGEEGPQDPDLQTRLINERNMRTIMERIPDLLWLTSGDRRQVHYISPGFGRLWDRDPEQLGEDREEWWNAVHRDDRAAVRSGLDQVAKGNPSEVEFRIRKSDESELWIRNRCWPICDDTDHSIQMIVGIAEDISQRRRLRETLAESRAMATIARMSGALANEFNNLLATILGYADLLEEGLELGPGREQVRAIASEAERAASLTRRLLVIANQGQGRRGDVDIHELIEGLRIRHEWPEGVEFRCDLSADKSVVQGDETLLMAAVDALIANAIEASSPQGTVTVSTVNRESIDESSDEIAGLNPEKSSIEIAIRDSGDGFRESDRARIFEPFVTTKKSVAHRGLGLSMAYGVAAGHDGSIIANGGSGEGATFSLVLPVGTAEAPAVRRTQDHSIRDFSPRGEVLIIDDDAAVIRVLESMIRSLGFSVCRAESGVEGVERFAERQPDIGLVVLDVNMPEMDGIEVFQSIRERVPDVPVLFASGRGPGRELRSLLDLDNVRFIHKPFRRRELAQMFKSF